MHSQNSAKCRNSLAGSVALGALTLLAAATPLQAQVISRWVAGDDSWFVGTNWSAGNVPNANTVAEVGNNGTVHVASGTATAFRLYVGWDGPSESSMLVENGAHFNCVEFAVVGNILDATGHLTITGAGSSLSMPNSLLIGDFAIGTVAVANGATLSSGTGNIGYRAPCQGVVDVLGPGSTWSVSQQIVIADQDGTRGTLNLMNGGVLNYNSLSDFIIGKSFGAQAGMTISGSQFTSNAAAVLGRNHAAFGAVHITGPTSS